MVKVVNMAHQIKSYAQSVGHLHTVSDDASFK